MKINYEKVLSLNPCYDPIDFFPDNWEGDEKAFCRESKIPGHDKAWVLWQLGLITEADFNDYLAWRKEEAKEYAVFEPETESNIDIIRSMQSELVNQENKKLLSYL